MAHPHRVCRPMSTWLTQQQLYARVASIVACALVASACDLGKHTHSHTTEREVPPARPVMGTSNQYLDAEGGSRVLGRDSSARCIALVCGSQVREVGPRVGKKLPSHDPDSHFTAYVAPKALQGCKVSRES